jgi:pectin methylesterase-like acyl-CoA thioesterase
MSVRAFVVCATLLLGLAATPAAAQTTIYVDGSSSCPGNGTAGMPFCTIQAAITAAGPAVTILIANGTYQETLLFDLHGSLYSGRDPSAALGCSSSGHVVGCSAG